MLSTDINNRQKTENLSKDRK